MSKKVVFVAGSPAESSRSSRLLEEVRQRVIARGVVAPVYSVRSFPAEDLLLGYQDAAEVRSYVEDVKSADGLVVSTPVYKASYTGVLKSLLDVLPPDSLQGGVALGIATARIDEHLEWTWRGLQVVFDFFRLRALPPVLLPDGRVFAPGSATDLAEEAAQLVQQRAGDIAEALGLR